jgi:hypothetical protein
MANVKGISVTTKENPTVISDSGKIRIGSIAPAFPPGRGPSAIGDAGKLRIGSIAPAFPPVRNR